MPHHFFTRSILMLLALTSPCVQAAGQGVILGVLEDVPGVYAGEPNSPQVRVVFRKVGKEWEAFPSNCPDQSCLKTISSQYPNEVVWTISFDGRNLGQVMGQTPKEFGYYSHVGLQQIKNSGAVPTIGKRSTNYGGFTDTSVYRPLVANSQPYFKDPESWKPAQPTADLVKLLRQHFRQKFPAVSNCANPDENVSRPWPYRDEDIRILKGYASRNAWFIARLRLEEYRCDGPTDDPFADQWLAVSPGLEVQFLGAAMWLVDAGDYDNDGRSELVFSIDDYNRGGYEIFYDDFRKHATFKFGYH
jgi:hypothetical protein